MDIALYVLAALLIVGGLAGSVLPSLPGIPMIFGGIWLVAAVDGYRHLGLWWLLIIGTLGGIGVIVDFIASTLGNWPTAYDQQLSSFFTAIAPGGMH